MNVINMQEFRKQPAIDKITGKLKEYDDYYSYSFFCEEMSYEDFQTEAIERENIFISFLQHKGKIAVASLLFPKSFGYERTVSWLDKHLSDSCRGECAGKSCEI